jgi:hypothetical protein
MDIATVISSEKGGSNRVETIHVYTFWNVTTCNPVKSNDVSGQHRRRRDSACRLLLAGFLFGLFSRVKMKTACSSETSMDFDRTTGHYIRYTLPNHRCKDLKSNIYTLFTALGKEEVKCQHQHNHSITSEYIIVILLLVPLSIMTVPF